jgi:hypothetical protein
MNSIPDSLPEHMMLVWDPAQLESLRNPVRKEIMAALTMGKEDFITEKTEEEKHLDDGTRITQTTVVKRPSTRFWLTILEILDNIRKKNPKSAITSRQCYYHMHEMVNQGLAEQYPVQPKSKKRNSRIRGLYFKPAARIFIPGPGEYDVDMLESLLRIEFSDDEKVHLRESFETIERAEECIIREITARIQHAPIEFDTLNRLLIRLAHIFLSDNADVLEHASEVKEILHTKIHLA